MKTIFFSESNIKGKVPRDFENARTEFGWSIMLDAEWCPLNDSPTERYDLGIIIIPKNNPRVDLYKYKLYCKNIAVMQEGPHWYFQDYSVENQIHYLNCLREADWVYCHNKSDIKYYKGLGCKDVRVMRSMMIPEGLDCQLTTSQKNGILLGGNFVSWYGGMDSYLVASEITDEQKYGVSMGRKQEQEDMIEDIKYLPYMNWREWINHIGQYKVGVHLMRTHAAGTFSMNLSWHGTPVIGYKGLDTQELLHPETTVEVGDLLSAKQIISRLYEDEFFYQECSEQTKKLFNKHYSEEAWLKDWKVENGPD